MVTPPPKWVAPLKPRAADEDEEGDAETNVLHAAEGLGGALGFWLPFGINRAKESASRIKKAVR